MSAILTNYIQAAMNKAAFKQLEDCSYFGEIPDLERGLVP